MEWGKQIFKEEIREIDIGKIRHRWKWNKNTKKSYVKK